jgi:hypothetical protein
MQIILLARTIPLPHQSAKHRLPIRHYNQSHPNITTFLKRIRTTINKYPNHFTVTKITHQQNKEQQNPNTVNTQINNIIQPFNDTHKITDPITHGITKTTWIDLINHHAAPPLRIVMNDYSNNTNHNYPKKSTNPTRSPRHQNKSHLVTGIPPSSMGSPRR